MTSYSRLLTGGDKLGVFCHNIRAANHIDDG